jgi:tetratricopeptide (TPR) repeat protein
MPTDAEAHNNLGWAYREKGMLDEAIAQFEIAVQLRPDYAGARSGLEEAYREKASRVGP